MFASLVILTHSSAQDSFLEAQMVDEESIVAGTIPYTLFLLLYILLLSPFSGLSINLQTSAVSMQKH